MYALSRRIDALHGYYGLNARADGERGSSFWFCIPYNPDHFTSSGWFLEGARRDEMSVLSEADLSTDFGEFTVDG